MDKPRRLAAIIIAASETETVEEYAARRDEIFNGLPDGLSEFVRTVYDDLRAVYKAPERKPVKISRNEDPDEILTGNFRKDLNPFE